MKHLSVGFFLIFLLLFPGVKAQQNHFIYIQTENKQPFYVKLDKQLFSSSASGYLIIPKLKDGDYNLSIGFPKKEGGEQAMLCIIDKKDIGFLLKNFGDKGWGLFNLQTLEVVMSGKGRDNQAGVEKTDAFSNMLSNVVNDPTIKQADKETSENNPATRKEEVKVSALPSGNSDKMQESKQPSKEAEKASQKEDVKVSEVISKESQGGEPLNSETSGTDDLRSKITRYLVNKSVEGIEMVFVDEINGIRDTVRILIPADKIMEPVIEKPSVEKATETQEPKKELELKDVANKEVKDEGNKFLEIELPNPNSKVKEKKLEQPPMGAQLDATDSKEKAISPALKSTMINSDCKKLAAEEDFLKLRKKMASENKDVNMLTISKKSFKARCYTVEQIKNLSVLFLKDEGKYAFFEMAYPFVSDSHNFPSLQSQLTDNYYIDRFKELVRH